MNDDEDARLEESFAKTIKAWSGAYAHMNTEHLDNDDDEDLDDQPRDATT